MESNISITKSLNSYTCLDEKQKRDIAKQISDLLKNNLDFVLCLFNDHEDLFHKDPFLIPLIEEIRSKCKIEKYYFKPCKRFDNNRIIKNDPLPGSIFLREENEMNFFSYPNIKFTDHEINKSKIIMVMGSLGSGKV